MTTAPTDRTDRVLVIGAGSSGLAAAKNLRDHGLTVDVVEREDDLGGNWNFGKPNSRVYESTHMISSKPFTQFPDFPMPDRYPDYLHHSQVLAYLRRYAEHFGLLDVIEFGTSVERCVPRPGGGWEVELHHAADAGPPAAADGSDRTGTEVEVRHYRDLVVANGHNWDPKLPTYPGQDGFGGELLHSARYKSADQLAGKRVVVVGAGNTGCDVIVEAAQRADVAYHSTRRAYWYAPKYALGRPADQVSDLVFALKLPTRVTQSLFELTAKLVVGRYERLGLPTPDHRFLETHPIVNQQLLYYVGHGAITPKPDIDRFEGREVVFTDGSRVEADLVVFATGYRIRFPFLDRSALDWQDGRPVLYRNVFHPGRDDLFVAGLIQPDSGQFCLVHWQTVAIARFLELRTHDRRGADAFLARARDHLEDRSDGGVRYLESTRHLVEVEHADYVADLDRDIRELTAAVALP
jgi:cation diffusion facilitator CzcD-associated flavoprotein CzcO